MVLVSTPISDNHNNAFKQSCYNAHLEVIKWFHGLGINIHDDDEHGFKWSCISGHLEVAKWLLEVKPSIAFQQFEKIKSFRQTCIDVQTPFIRQYKNKLFCTMYALQHDDIAYECLPFL